ncbi:response regulator transcription factor [Pantoea sp. GbtcB22]|uniref:response regulator transcription factor n=1 Tax=Pantoea sp. GbtcB22 TaxID=2824767 RepID=UPI001C2F4D7A|nr:response regulator transcription factor [Pantoea sp. GbtcB22]
MIEPTVDPIRVMVLDDHPLIRNAYEFTMKASSRIELVAVCSSRKEMLEILKKQSIDVLILDYILGDDGVDGLVMVQQVRSHYPDLSILVSSSVESPAIVQLILQAGVKGFIGKSKDFNEIIRSIEYVASGKIYLSQDMQYKIQLVAEGDREMLAYIPKEGPSDELRIKLRALSPREMEVLRCFLDGMSIKQIAEKYSRHRKTVSGHKQVALRKLGLRSDAELFKYKDYFK